MSDTTDQHVAAWPLNGVEPRRRSDLYSLVDALATGTDRQADDIQTLLDERHLLTATGERLDLIGETVGAYRKTGESDDKFRRRIIAIYAQRTSNATFDELASITLSILGLDPDQVTLDTPPVADEATLAVNAPTEAIQTSPFSQSEIVTLLEGAVPAGHEVVVNLTGTFEFASSSYSPGTDSNLTNGTLSTTLTE